MIRATSIKLLITGLALAWLAGCVQTKPTPGYARAGDHIVLGLGGIERNAGGDPTLSKDDLTITLTDFNGTPHQLQARFLFKSYPDPASQANAFSIDGTNATFGLNGSVPFDGGWFVVAPLTVPGDYDNPLNLAVGQASIAITSDKLTNTGDTIEGDLTNIPIEIIPGTSPEDQDFVRQFIGYVSFPKAFLIAPDSLDGVTTVGGAYLEIDYNDDSFFNNGLEPMILPTDLNPFTQINYKVLSNGDGTGTIRAMILNPEGFRAAGAAGPNSALLSNLSVKLLYFSAGNVSNAAAAKANFSLNTAESYYIDLNGADLTGVTPTMTHVEDL